MRLKKIVMVPLAALILSASVLVSFGAEGSAGAFSTYEAEKKQMELEKRSREQPRFWTEYPVFAHALGTVQGRANTNSKDAFLESYQAGQRVFEVDLQLTSDGTLVARHDWEQISYYNLEQTYAGVMDHETFLSTPICFYYTTLDIQGLMELLIQHPDVYLVTDSKDTDEQSVRAQLRGLAQAVEATGRPELWNRIIVQIYHQEMYTWVKEETPVTNFIFTLYQIENPDYYQIGAFCQEQGIQVVTMAAERLTKERSDILHSYGCKVYLHTVNRLRQMLESSWGADGFYSDCVTPSQLEEVLAGTNQMYLSQWEGDQEETAQPETADPITGLPTTGVGLLP